jgi:hypothetical protein
MDSKCYYLYFWTIINRSDADDQKKKKRREEMLEKMIFKVNSLSKSG